MDFSHKFYIIVETPREQMGKDGKESRQFEKVRKWKGGKRER